MAYLANSSPENTNNYPSSTAVSHFDITGPSTLAQGVRGLPVRPASGPSRIGGVFSQSHYRTDSSVGAQEQRVPEYP